MDLLFRKGVLQHLENPPGYGPDKVIAFIEQRILNIQIVQTWLIFADLYGHI